MKMCLSLLVSIVLVNPTLSQPKPTPNAEITAGEILAHIKFLASDELAGRKTGEEGNRKAARYIAEEFKSYGLKPLGDNGDYFQSFRIISALSAGTNSSMRAGVAGRTIAFKLDEDFRPMANSSDTAVTAGIVFVGYGIAADSLGYDDYAGADVKGKVVMFLRFTPDTVSRESKFRPYDSPYLKAFTAREKGARGIIMVTGPADEEKPGLVPLRLEEQPTSSGLPVINLKSTDADTLLLLSGLGRSIRMVQQQIMSTRKPSSFELSGVTVTMRTEVVKQYSSSANVLGYLEGEDPKLRGQVLVIGAHFDHLGMGGQGSGSLKPDTVAVHHGADDNASGTAGLLELAQNLASRRHELKRSVLFASFSGEEEGLLGSAFYVQHPSLPLDSTVGMINMDMVGRLKDDALIVEGMGTSSSWEPIVRKENSDSTLKLTLKPDGYGPSDHSSFYSKNLPVMFFFTNLHEDYHKPSDTWDKINAAGEEKVVRFVGRIASDVANADARPPFTRAAAQMPQAGSDRRGARVSLGVVPDFAGDSVGLRISGTRPGSPAEKAGLKEGDVIVKFAGKDVKNIYDFMYILEACKPNDKVDIVVMRANKPVTLTATLEVRKQ